LHATLSRSLERVRRHHQALGDLFPTVGEGSRYRLTENDNWLTGFWTGLLWLAYAATGDEDLRAHAKNLLPSFEERLDQRVHITHDLGFPFYPQRQGSVASHWRRGRPDFGVFGDLFPSVVQVLNEGGGGSKVGFESTTWGLRS
jgi:unsaturated chondroitin disaccharide hydrolase